MYEVLPHVINRLRGAGYRFVTVAECLGRTPCQRVGAPEARNVRILLEVPLRILSPPSIDSPNSG